jgi:hypothetical protein
VLRSVSPDDLAAGQGIDDHVTDLFTGGVGSPSQIGIAVMNVMVESAISSAPRPDRAAITGAVLYGYWLREYAERVRIAVPSVSLPPGLPLTAAGGIDHARWEEPGEALVEARGALLERVREYAFSDGALGWMPLSVAAVVFTWAAAFIHANEPLRGRVAKAMDVERTAGCARLGYAVRSFELAVGEPMLPYGSYLDGGAPRDGGSTA